MDLDRKILMAVEEHEHGFAPRDVPFDGYSEEQVGYHAYIMIEGGLVEGADVTTRGSDSPEAIITRLTWAGHEFVESAREPSRWQQAKDLIGKVGGASIAVWTAVLTDLVKKNLGI